MAAVALEADPPHGGATLRLAGLAVAASAAGDVDRRCHAIAGLPIGDTIAHFNHIAGEFVADDAWQVPERLAARQQVKIGAAQSARAHLDQRLAGTGARNCAACGFKFSAIVGDHHGAHRAGHAHSFRPVTAMPWMNARCRKKNRTIIGSVPSTAMAIS